MPITPRIFAALLLWSASFLPLDRAAAPPAVTGGPERVFRIGRRYLNIPIKNGAPKRQVTIWVDRRPVLTVDVELADADPDWWAFLDLGAWQGRELVFQADRLGPGSRALERLEQSNEPKDAGDLYHEALRPQIHFSSRRGWNNDPNGLVFYRGEYHLFYQHNPYGWGGANKHWGHAVSTDLLHWREFSDALAPDALGAMYSGSAVVDWENTSGLGTPGHPPQVLIYTAAGQPFTQCLAFSGDGRNYAKFGGNPVIGEITPGNRDPKVIRYQPGREWVMCLYVGPHSAPRDERGNPVATQANMIEFLHSTDLRHWTAEGRIRGFYECPDLFELALDGNAAARKWVLTDASSGYMVGKFDGRAFRPETAKLTGQRGKDIDFYAAQTFSDIPAQDGRRIQIGWLRAPSPGMPFNQAMSLPMELKLRSTADGPRLTRTPVAELERLRVRSCKPGPRRVAPDGDNPFAKFGGELLEIRAEFEPEAGAEIAFTVRGIPVTYDASRQEIIVNGHRAAAPLQGGRQRLAIYIDRTVMEVFASDGLTYVPMPVIPSARDKSLGLTASGGAAKFSVLEAYELKSIW